MTQAFTIKDSLAQLLKICKGNKSEAGRRIGVSRTMIHRYVKGQSRPGGNTIERLSNAVQPAV